MPSEKTSLIFAAMSTMTPITRQAVIYARVSSKEQEDEGGQNTLHQKPLCDLTKKMDQLLRILKIYVVIDEFSVNGQLVNDGVIISRGSRCNDWLEHRIRVLIDPNVIDNLSEEPRRGLLEMAEDGIWPTFARSGYRNVESPHRKRRIDIDTTAARHIQKMLARCATGKKIFSGSGSEDIRGWPGLLTVPEEDSGHLGRSHLASLGRSRQIRMAWAYVVIERKLTLSFIYELLRPIFLPKISTVFLARIIFILFRPYG